MQKFPELIYVRWEEAGGGEKPFMIAEEKPNAEDGEDGERIAIYELKEVKIMKIVVSLV